MFLVKVANKAAKSALRMPEFYRKRIAYAEGYAYAKKAGSTAWLRLELEKEGLL
jgi:hypothetical protein